MLPAVVCVLLAVCVAEVVDLNHNLHHKVTII